MSRTEQLSPSESMERNQPGADQEKSKTRRPPNTAFRQQRLKAWQPILTPKTVLPLLFVVGVIFAPIGGLLLYSSAQVQELWIDYTGCNDTTGNDFTPIPQDRYEAFLTQNSSRFYQFAPTWKSTALTVPIGRTGQRSYDTRQCSIQFEMPENLKPPVFLYYQLTNFYQNHRRYVQSYNQDQLMGNHPAVDNLGTCDPLNYVHLPNDQKGPIYYPCGLIANSLFNDTISQPARLNVQGGPSNQQTYNMTQQGTAWDSDSQLYRNGNDTGYPPDQVLVPPPNWALRYPENYTDEFPIPDLKTDYVFQNWMRTAGLPTFSKLYLRNDEETMPSGRYEVNVTYNFPVASYGGKKTLIISTRTVMGGRNPSLGIAYIVVAGVCVLLGAIFTVTHLIKPRKLGDHNYLSWNNDKPTTATTTGRAPRPNEAA